MAGKFFILAVAAIALVQADDFNFEYEKQKALNRIQGMNTGAEKGHEAAVKEVSINKKYLVMKQDIFLEKGVYARAQVKEGIQAIAAEMEKKAEEMKKPESTIQCIEKAEKASLERVDASAPKYEAEIKKHQKTASEAIDAAAKPLPEIKKAIAALYTSAVNEVKSCKDSNCLRVTMNKIRQQYDAIHKQLRQVFMVVEPTFGTFMKNVSTAFGSYKQTVNKIKEEAVQAMKKCLA